MQKNKRRQYRVTLGDAIGAHERAISRFGGKPGIHDLNLIESAIARPYSGYYRPIHKKAAALLHSLVLNHGFVDGNKRTAFYLFFLFLEKSGFTIENDSIFDDGEQIEHLILDLATHFLSFNDLVVWLRDRVQSV